MKYNIRDKSGKFCQSLRAVKPKIVSNRLYDWKGTIVRVIGATSSPLVAVCVHKKLYGIVHATELKTISKDRVEAYLKNADGKLIIK